MRRFWSFSFITIALLTGCGSIDESSSLSESVGEGSAALLDFAWGQTGLNSNEQFLRIAEVVPGFGGLYLEEGQPVVYLKDLQQSDAARAALTPLVESLLAMSRNPEEPAKTPEIRFVQGRYDFKELYGWYGAIRNALNLEDVVLTDIDEAKNVIRVGVSSDAPLSLIRRMAIGKGVPEDAYVVEKVEPIRFRANSLQDRWWPPVGGLQIKNNNGSSCTLGYNANHFVLGRGFITASHCTLVQGGTEGTKFYQAGNNIFGADFVGTEAHDPQYYSGADCPSGRVCRHSDFSFVKYDSSKTLGRLGKLAMPLARCSLPTTSCLLDVIQDESLLYDVVNTSFVSAVAVGQDLDKIGRTTGQTHGLVNSTCFDANVSGTNITMICQYGVAAGSTFGDSGGPVFMRHGTTSSIDAIGILWGGGSTSDFAFSLMWDVQNETGGLGSISLQ